MSGLGFTGSGGGVTPSQVDAQVAAMLGVRGRARKSANQTAGDFTTQNFVTWDAEDFDVGGYHDVATSNQRFTFPGGLTVRLRAQLYVYAGTAGEWLDARLLRDAGDLYAGQGVATGLFDARGVCVLYMESVQQLVDPAYFDVRLQIEADASCSIQSAASWFEYEVLA